MENNPEKIYSVGELNRLVKGVLEGAFAAFWLEGEVSNFRRPASGHMYFTLKDENAQIRAVYFRGSQRGLQFMPQSGMQVRVYGELTVYEPSGEYQVLVRRMEEGGQGALHARFEALKKALQAEGLFDSARKKPLPLLPQRIGVVTSATGAAFKDILNVIRRRFPNMQVVLAPVKVQGDGAAAEIAAAISRFNEYGRVDVMIVGRGGGSLEDLWCFNEEIVARAIAASRIPVISAVGHEIDYTIADFAADQRAPTPSAAAELVVGTKAEFEERIGNYRQRLVRALRDEVRHLRARLGVAAGSYVFREPGNLALLYRQRLAAARQSMTRALDSRVVQTRQRLDESGMRLGHLVELRVRHARQRLQAHEGALRAMNPLAVLTRGYSITLDKQGQAVRSVAQVKPGEKVFTRLQDGEFESEVL